MGMNGERFIAPMSSWGAAAGAGGGGAGAAGGAGFGDAAVPVALNPRFLQDFDESCGAISAQLDIVDRCSTTIEGLSLAVESNVDPDEDKRIHTALGQNVKESQDALMVAKTELKRVKARGAEMESVAGGGSAEAQLCIPRYKALLHRYMATLQRNQRAKASFKHADVGVLVQQARLLPEYEGKGEDEMRRELESNPGRIDEVIVQRRSVHHDVSHAYAIAQSRAHDVEMVARSIEEVAAMMADLAELVSLQDEVVDRIVENADQAVHYVHAGNRRLESAVDYRKKTRKRMCCLLIAAVVIVGILSGTLGGILGG